MSRGGSSNSNERCVFCGWTRKNAYQSVRFFCIPKEPGLKRVRWLQVFGDREITNRDRVCSVHFRQGRPSSDPSHEDFVPHLYLNNEPPPEVLDYLESLAETNTKLEKVTPTINTKSLFPFNFPSETSAFLRVAGRNSKPAILKRKRRPKDELYDDDDAGVSNPPQSLTQLQHPAHHQQIPHDAELYGSLVEEQPNDLHSAAEQEHKPSVKFTAIQRNIVDAVGMKPGQTVIIRRRIAAPKTNKEISENKDINFS